MISTRMSDFYVLVFNPCAFGVSRRFEMSLFHPLLLVYFSSVCIVLSSSDVKRLSWLSVALDHVIEAVIGGDSLKSVWTSNPHIQTGLGP